MSYNYLQLYVALSLRLVIQVLNILDSYECYEHKFSGL